MVFALFEQFGMRYYDRIIMFGNPDDPYSDAEKGVDFESGVYGPPQIACTDSKNGRQRLIKNHYLG